MKLLKDIAADMGGVHVRTAKKWWKKLDAIQARLRRPRVRPDVRGHGPHKWHDATAARLIALYESFYNAQGTTPALVRAKYSGDLSDARQITFSEIYTPCLKNSPAVKPPLSVMPAAKPLKNTAAKPLLKSSLKR
jgi:hypothetical protein